MNGIRNEYVRETKHVGKMENKVKKAIFRWADSLNSN